MAGVRKGFYFSIDALIAVTLVLTGLGVILQPGVVQEVETLSSSYQRSDTVAEDAAQLMMNQQLGKALTEEDQEDLLNDTVLEEDDLSGSVLEAIATLWASNQSGEAGDLAESFFDGVVPDDMAYRVVVDNEGRDVIYNSSFLPANASLLARSTRIVSGVARNQPTQGFLAQASLTDIGAVKSEYHFFGGYVGDGNLTANISLPDYQNIVRVVLEADVGSNLSIGVNGVDAGLFNESAGFMRADNWTVCNQTWNQDACSALQQGNNEVTFGFEGNNTRIAGGFLRVDYNESDSLDTRGEHYQVHEKRLTGINGLINLFDGVNVPGTLHGLEARINYESEASIFFQIGNATLFERDDGGSDFVIDNSSMHGNLTEAGLVYSDLSNTTIPARVGVSDLRTVPGIQGAVDAVGTTDASGNQNANRDGVSVWEESKNATKLFVDIITNASQARGGLTAFDDDVHSYHRLTTNRSDLHDEVDSWSTGGPTCVACGLIRTIGTLIEGQNLTTALSPGEMWRYTTSTPPADWNQQGFDDSGWSQGRAPLGYGGLAHTPLGEQDTYWFRTSFDYLENLYRQPFPVFSTAGSVDVWLNGEKVHSSRVNGSGERWDQFRGLWMNRSGMWHLSDSDNVTGNTSWYFGLEEVTHYRTGEVEEGSLVSPWINISRVDDPVLSFDQRRDIDSNNNRHLGFVEVSDGSGWDELASYTASTGWQHTEFDLSSYDGDIRFRFRFDSVDPVSSVYGGWWVDNVTLGGFSSDVVNWSMLENQDNVLAVEFQPDHQSFQNGSISLTDRLANGTFTNTTFNSTHVVLQSGETQGRFVSPVLDADRTASWEDVDESISIPADTSADVSYGVNASGSWVYQQDAGAIPNNRYLRFRIDMDRDNDSVDSPAIDELSANFSSYGAAFDMELPADEFRYRSTVLLSAGDSNSESEMEDVPDHTDTGSVDPEDHTIEAACRARERHGIRVHAVDYSDPGETLEAFKQVANCSDGEYYDAETGELEELYDQITHDILEATVDAQRVIVEGTVDDELFADSWLRVNYSAPDRQLFGQYRLSQESDRFGGAVSSPKNGSFLVPDGSTLTDAQVYTYSARYWTDRAHLFNESDAWERIFALWDYESEYEDIGEPFMLQVPVGSTRTGVNNISIDSGENRSWTRGGSPDARVVYDLLVDGSVGYGEVMDKSAGGNKTFESDYENFTLAVGSDTEDEWDPESDAIDNATERLMQKLDVDGDGVVDFQIDEDSIKIGQNSLSGLRWLWGPAQVSVEVWQE